MSDENKRLLDRLMSAAQILASVSENDQFQGHGKRSEIERGRLLTGRKKQQLPSVSEPNHTAVNTAINPRDSQQSG